MYQYLIADDEPLIRKGTIRKIEKMGLPVSCAYQVNNAIEAIEFLSSEKVDFIITDMDMPKADGTVLLDFLKINFPHLPVIVISGYSSFQYMQKSVQSNTVNYILKPFKKEELQVSIEEIISDLKSDLVDKANENELILNYIVGQKSKYGHQLLQQLLDKSSEPLILIITNSEQKLSLIFNHKLPDTSVHISLIPSTQLKELPSNLNTFYVISSPINTVENFHIAYQSCIDAYNQTPIQQLSTTIYSNNAPAPLFETPNSTISELFYLLESGNSKQLKENLENYFHHLLSKNVSLLSLKLIILDLLMMTKKLTNQYFIETPSVTLPKEEKHILEKIFSPKETIEYGTELLINLSKAMSFEKIYHNTDVIQNIQSYIDNHYHETITLELLSSLFFLNPTYISAQFKEKVGIKYIDYINQLRLEEAKKLLITSTKKATIIGKLVGYDNEKYFYRIFKKYTSLTPEQYRNKHKI